MTIVIMTTDIMIIVPIVIKPIVVNIEIIIISHPIHSIIFLHFFHPLFPFANLFPLLAFFHLLHAFLPLDNLLFFSCRSACTCTAIFIFYFLNLFHALLPFLDILSFLSFSTPCYFSFISFRIVPSNNASILARDPTITHRLCSRLSLRRRRR